MPIPLIVWGILGILAAVGISKADVEEYEEWNSDATFEDKESRASYDGKYAKYENTKNKYK